jgi:tRNA (guanosine-2'-O-)-methyltransferase
MPERERTQRRKQRILEVLARRQADFCLVLNNIHDPHNVSAVLRSCDAFGVGEVRLLYTSTAFPVLGKKSSASAKKWVEIKRHDSARELVRELREAGRQVLATGFGPGARPLADWDLTRPTAVILGNEHSGVEDELDGLAPDQVYIPMLGMVQSLNVSVAAAVILYEAYRQRWARGLYEKPSLSPEQIEALAVAWLKK